MVHILMHLFNIKNISNTIYFYMFPDVFVIVSKLKFHVFEVHAQTSKVTPPSFENPRSAPGIVSSSMYVCVHMHIILPYMLYINKPANF